MRVAVTHRWRVTTAEARRIQDELREKWLSEDRLGTVQTVAGLDVAFVLKASQALQAKQNRWGALREANRAIAGVVVYKYPEMKELERTQAMVRLEFPYVPWVFEFWEIPALLAALRKLKTVPDLFFCDGQGYAHPRRMGLATHLRILLDRPAIGCAKSILIGEHRLLGRKKGMWAPIMDGQNDWRCFANQNRRKAGLCVAGADIAPAGGTADAFGDRREEDSSAHQGRGSLCKRSEAQVGSG